MKNFRIDYTCTSQQGVQMPQTDFIQAEYYGMDNGIITFYDTFNQMVAVYTTGVRIVKLDDGEVKENGN